MHDRRIRNTGSVYQRSDGRWYGAIDMGYIKGRRTKRYVTGKTKEEVENEVRLLQSKIARGESILIGKQSYQSKYGTIYQNSDGLWSGVAVLGQVGRLPKRKYVYGMTRDIVEDMLKKIYESYSKMESLTMENNNSMTSSGIVYDGSVKTRSEMMEERIVQESKTAIEKLYPIFGNNIWTAQQFCDILGVKFSAVGAKTKAMARRGFIERISVGRYRIKNNDQDFKTIPADNIDTNAIKNLEDKSLDSRPSIPFPMFLQAGSMFFGASNIAWIESNDCQVTVGLNVQETRPNGYIAPVTFSFDTSDAYDLLNGVAVLRGELNSNVKKEIQSMNEKCQTLEEHMAKCEQDRDAAVALATELESKLNTMRKMLE